MGLTPLICSNMLWHSVLFFHLYQMGPAYDTLGDRQLPTRTNHHQTQAQAHSGEILPSSATLIGPIVSGYPLETILEAQSYLCEACALGLDRECRTQEEVIQYCSRGNEQDEESGLSMALDQREKRLANVKGSTSLKRRRVKPDDVNTRHRLLVACTLSFDPTTFPVAYTHHVRPTVQDAAGQPFLSYFCYPSLSNRKRPAACKVHDTAR
jgi:hypothetical protein